MFQGCFQAFVLISGRNIITSHPALAQTLPQKQYLPRQTAYRVFKDSLHFDKDHCLGRGLLPSTVTCNLCCCIFLNCT